MQSYWEVRSAEQSLFSQNSIVFSEVDDDLAVEAFWGRSQFLTSGRWWGTRKDCRKGVKLRTVSEVQSRMVFALLNLTRRSWNERKVYKQASMSSLVHICAMEYVQLITTLYVCWLVWIRVNTVLFICAGVQGLAFICAIYFFVVHPLDITAKKTKRKSFVFLLTMFQKFRFSTTIARPLLCPSHLNCHIYP